MHKHLLCAAFNIKLTIGSGNAGTCEKLHDRSQIRLRQKAGVCASALTELSLLKAAYCRHMLCLLFIELSFVLKMNNQIAT
jgi:hypothetical protein